MPRSNSRRKNKSNKPRHASAPAPANPPRRYGDDDYARHKRPVRRAPPISHLPPVRPFYVTAMPHAENDCPA